MEFIQAKKKPSLWPSILFVLSSIFAVSLILLSTYGVGNQLLNSDSEAINSLLICIILIPGIVYFFIITPYKNMTKHSPHNIDGKVFHYEDIKKTTDDITEEILNRFEVLVYIKYKGTTKKGASFEVHLGNPKTKHIVEIENIISKELLHTLKQNFHLDLDSITFTSNINVTYKF
ncbi:hypothetical protein AAGG74_16465 [Bacillus mexicanus]|uniref:hypothetical protein n=1 Tax=Bacillus mexicanus TaxID=2834415 RepID=UPI003D2538E9